MQGLKEKKSALKCLKSKTVPPRTFYNSTSDQKALYRAREQLDQTKAVSAYALP